MNTRELTRFLITSEADVQMPAVEVPFTSRERLRQYFIEEADDEQQLSTPSESS